MRLWLGFICVLLVMAVPPVPVAHARVEDDRAAKPHTTLAVRARQPVALALIEGGQILLAANHRSGTISVIDLAAHQVIAEHNVGRGLADLAMLPDARHALAVDQAANQLLLLDSQGRSIRVVERMDVSPDPVRVTVAKDGSFACVSSRWSRRLTFIGLAKRDKGEASPAVSKLGTLDLPFCPQQLALVADGSKLIAADAFGGKLAIIETKGRAVEQVRSLPAHNIRGLAFAPDGQTLVLAHQVLNPLAQTRFDDVHWGSLLRNHLRVLRTSHLLPRYSDADLLDWSHLFDLGDIGYGAGDPGEVVFDVKGNLIVALSGVDEVAMTASPAKDPRRIRVGRRPTAVLPSPDGRSVYVANSLDDTISVVEIATGVCTETVSLGSRPEPSAAERGERLFTSAKLSNDGWISCHSCHTDGHTNNLVSDTLSDGSYGAPKRVPSLLGVAATGPWTWTASVARLDDQIRKSILTTMHGTKPTDQQVADLVAYLGTLAPPSPQLISPGAQQSPAIERGRGIFEARKCSACHNPPEFTSPQRYDVGLSDEVGNHEFNPPSLRGLSARDSLLHDGRVKSLEDVFQKTHHPRGLELSGQEIADLVAFLRSL